MSHYERIRREFMDNEISYIDAIEELQKYLEIDSFRAEEIASRWADNMEIEPCIYYVVECAI